MLVIVELQLLEGLAVPLLGRICFLRELVELSKTGIQVRLRGVFLGEKPENSLDQVHDQLLYVVEFVLG